MITPKIFNLRPKAHVPGPPQGLSTDLPSSTKRSQGQSTEVAQRKRAGPITQRSLDRNQSSVLFLRLDALSGFLLRSETDFSELLSNNIGRLIEFVSMFSVVISFP